MMYKIAVLPGDGIGKEITPEAVEVLKKVGGKCGLSFEFEEALIGGCAIDATGGPFPALTQRLVKASDAVLLGAVGGARGRGVDYSIRPGGGLLGLREV